MKPKAIHEQVSVEMLLPFLKELLQEGKSVNLTVTGNSMMPLLRDRLDSVVLVKPESLKRFDIVLYEQQSGKVMLHRIVKCLKDGYMIVGDNQIEVDGPVEESRIVALVSGFNRNGQFIPCSKWWVRLYAFIWGHGRIFRNSIFPFVRIGGKVIKRLERMERKDETDH